MEDSEKEIAYWAGRLIGYDQAWEVAEEIVEAIKKAQNQALRIHDVVGQSEQLTAFAEYCDKEHGLFIPSWMIDGYNKSR